MEKRPYPVRVQYEPKEKLWYVHCGNAENLPMSTVLFRDRKELARFLDEEFQFWHHSLLDGIGE